MKEKKSKSIRERENMSRALPNTPGISPKVSLLHDRALLLAEARQFFNSRNVLEVDCPIISPSASVDAYIDLIPAICGGSETRYLHSSPEFGMKRLISQGIGDIYQLSHVFRDGEWGAKHNPEFMMAEWYRKGFSFADMVQETADFIRLFLGNLPLTTLSYREAFQTYAGFDYLQITSEKLKGYLQEKEIDEHELDDDDKDGRLNLILGTLIEPHLGGKDSVLWFIIPQLKPLWPKHSLSTTNP